jgi:IS4 transposase
MNRRVDEREWIQYQWDYLLALLGGEGRVARLAYETSAFTRRRKIESPADLLRLIFTWAVAERSLQETAALAAETDLADVSDVALLGRFCRAEDWLGAILGDLLCARNIPPGVATVIRLIDATSISCRGSKNTERRVHLSMDLRTNRTTAVELTDWRGGESLERFTFRPGEIVIGDRGYGTRTGLAHVARAGAHFIVRFAWSNLPLETADGEPLDVITTLRSVPEARAGDFNVQFRAPNGQVLPCRLVAIRKSEPAAESARQKILADGRRHGNPKIDVRTLEAAGYVFVLTNLPDEISAESVLDLYRFRWQIELKFKTLKSVLHLGNPPTRSGEMLNVYLYSKLIVALLIEDFVYNAESFSPWGYPLQANSLLALDASSA